MTLPTELNEDLIDILGMPCFRAGPIAHLFNAAGEAKIPPRAENEQAFVLHWLLGLYLEHGEKWRPEAAARLRAMQEKLQATRFARTEG